MKRHARAVLTTSVAHSTGEADTADRRSADVGSSPTPRSSSTWRRVERIVSFLLWVALAAMLWGAVARQVSPAVPYAGDLAARLLAVALELPTCRACGCSDLDACVDLDGWPCQWVEADLCSACDPAAPHPRHLVNVHALAEFL